MIETKSDKRLKFLLLVASIIIVFIGFQYQQSSTSRVPVQELVAENNTYIYFVQAINKANVTQISLYQMNKLESYKTILFDQIEISSNVEAVYYNASAQQTIIQTTEKTLVVSEDGFKEGASTKKEPEEAHRISFSIDDNGNLCIEGSDVSYELPQSKEVVDILKGSEVYIAFTEKDWTILKK